MPRLLHHISARYLILFGPKGYGDRKNAILGNFACY